MRLGQDDKKDAERILGNCFSTLLLFSAVLTVVFLLTKGMLLRWFGASDITYPYADIYLTIYTCGTFFALLSMGMNYFITAQGYPMLGMVTTLIGAVLNIILDPLFIFVFHMEIAGAAAATVLAQLASCLFVLFVLYKKSMPVPPSPSPSRTDAGKKDSGAWLLPLPHSGYRQHYNHRHECGPSVPWRPRLRGYPHYLCHHCTKLHDAHHLTHAGHYRRLPAAYQL